MTTKKANLTELDKQEIRELMETIEIATMENIDQALWLYGRQVVYAYSHWIITDKQKQKLAEYKIRKQNEKMEKEDKIMKDRIISLASGTFVEPPTLHQVWIIDGRVVVASVVTYTENREEKQKANGGIIYEVFRSRHPNTYEYCKKNFQIAVKLEK